MLWSAIFFFALVLVCNDITFCVNLDKIRNLPGQTFTTATESNIELLAFLGIVAPTLFDECPILGIRSSCRMSIIAFTDCTIDCRYGYLVVFLDQIYHQKAQIKPFQSMQYGQLTLSCNSFRNLSKAIRIRNNPIICDRFGKKLF